MSSDARHWPQTQRVWRQFDQLDLVMQRNGASPVVAARMDGGKAMAKARNLCLSCLYQAKCRAGLEAGAAETIMEFCPNAGFLSACR